MDLENHQLSYAFFSKEIAKALAARLADNVPLREHKFDVLERSFQHLLLSCESPIEGLLGTALLFASVGVTPIEYLPNLRDGKGTEWFASHCLNGEVVFSPQVNVGPYRVDFLVICNHAGHRRYIVVECDGHEFHERTVEQATSDRKRDRYFAALGIAVLRFTGTEICAYPERCAGEVASAVQAQFDLIASTLRNAG